MKDYWKFLAFGLAAISGHMSSSIAKSVISQTNQLPQVPGQLLLIGGIGLFTGFLIDELIPTYLQNIRGGGSSGASDFDAGGGGDDFDFDQ